MAAAARWSKKLTMAEGNPNIGDKIECPKCGEEIDFDYYQCEQEAEDYLLENCNLYGYYELRQQFAIVDTFPFTVSCPKCKADTKIHVEVEAEPFWSEYDSESDRDPDVDHFEIIELRRTSGSSQLPLPPNLLDDTDEAYFDESIEIPGFGRHEYIQHINLRIICKTRMNNGYCYIGLDENRQRLLRPILRTQSGQCCWPGNHDFHVGTSYKFNVLLHPDVPHEEDLPTPPPHCREDMLVGKVVEQIQSNEPWVPNVLENIAHTNIPDIFPAIEEQRFIHINTNCPSVGILKTKESRIRLYKNSYGKTRLNINNRYTFPVTGIDVAEPIFRGQRNALVLLGLGRPFSDNNRFQPARCYILVLGIFLY